eukprot:5428798-Pleurochrysis_carterae.AAC.2
MGGVGRRVFKRVGKARRGSEHTEIPVSETADCWRACACGARAQRQAANQEGGLLGDGLIRPATD